MHRMNRIIAAAAAATVFSAQPRRAPSKTSVVQRTPHPANPVHPGHPASDTYGIFRSTVLLSRISNPNSKTAGIKK